MRSPVVTELPLQEKVLPVGAVTDILPVLPPSVLALLIETVIGNTPRTVALVETELVPQVFVERTTYKPPIAVVALRREMLVPVAVKPFAAVHVVVAASEDTTVTEPVSVEPAQVVGTDIAESAGLLLIVVTKVLVVAQPFTLVMTTLNVPAVLKRRLFGAVLAAPPDHV